MDSILNIIGSLPYPPNVTPELLMDYAFILVIGCFGGLAREASDFFDKGLPSGTKELIARCFIGSFAAFTVASFCYLLPSGETYGWVAAAAASFSGTELLRKVIGMFESKLDELNGTEVEHIQIEPSEEDPV